MERERIVALIAGVGIRAMLEQQPYRVWMRHGPVQAGGAVIAGACQGGLLIQEPAQGREISRRTGAEELLEERLAHLDLRARRVRRCRFTSGHSASRMLYMTESRTLPSRRA